MARPQSPELRRSGNTPALDPDNIGTRLEARRQPTSSGPAGPIPDDNQPGHRPERDQDKPDPDAFVERFRTVEPGDPGEEHEQDGRAGDGASPSIAAPLLHARRLVGIGHRLATAAAGAVLEQLRKERSA